MPTLNLDCWNSVVDQLQHDPRTLFQLLTVSRQFFTIASRVLYKHAFSSSPSINCNHSLTRNGKMSTFSHSALEQLLYRCASLHQESTASSNFALDATPLYFTRYHDLVTTIPRVSDMDFDSDDDEDVGGHHQQRQQWPHLQTWFAYTDIWAEKIVHLTVQEKNIRCLVALAPRFLSLKTLQIQPSTEPTSNASKPFAQRKVIEKTMKYLPDAVAFVKAHRSALPGKLQKINVEESQQQHEYWADFVELQNALGRPRSMSLDICCCNPQLHTSPLLSLPPSRSPELSRRHVVVDADDENDDDENNSIADGDDRPGCGRCAQPQNWALTLPVHGLRSLRLEGSSAIGMAQRGVEKKFLTVAPTATMTNAASAAAVGEFLSRCRQLESVELKNVPAESLKWGVLEKRQQNEQHRQQEQQRHHHHQQQQPHSGQPLPRLRDSLVQIQSLKVQSSSPALFTDALFAFGDSLKEAQFRSSALDKQHCNTTFAATVMCLDLGEGQSRIQKLPRLETLSIEAPQIRFDAFVPLLAYSNLQSLTLRSGYSLSPPSSSSTKWDAPPTLRILSLSGQCSNDINIQSLKRLTELQQLELRDTQLQPHILPTAVDDLDISNWHLPHLLSVALYGQWARRFQGRRLLETAPKLESLCLDFTLTSNGGVCLLSEPKPNLELSTFQAESNCALCVLSLTGCSIVDSEEWVHTFTNEQFSNLSRLSLTNVHCSTLGCIAALTHHMVQLPVMEQVHVQSTEASLSMKLAEWEDLGFKAIYELGQNHQRLRPLVNDDDLHHGGRFFCVLSFGGNATRYYLPTPTMSAWDKCKAIASWVWRLLEGSG